MNSDTQNVQPVSTKTQQLQDHIQKQMSAGLKPDEIAGQLRQAGWNENDINSGFAAVQKQIMPNPAIVSGDQMPTGKQRGRIKTGWLLFKESLKVLRNNEGLTRYVFMSLVMGIVVAIPFVVVMIVGHNSFLVKSGTVDASGNAQYNISPLGYIPLFFYYVAAFYVVNIYGVGLAANVLDVFHGRKQKYGDYMKLARSKAGTILVFSLIEATVGLILRAIAERSRLIGRIVISIIGLAWSLSRLFVVPIIASSDEGSFQAIKDSTQLLISTWGENLIGRVSLAGAVFLFYLLIAVPVFFVLLIIFAAIGGSVGAIIVGVLFVLSMLVFSILVSAASNILNVALFYYARTKQIPAAFDPELINSVFIHKKQKKQKFKFTN